jgi:N-hydroxyarylamine O-acetyltransferase
VVFTPELSAYFTRIGYAGSREPTLAHLNAIILAHVQSIPFENLDVLLGRPIDLAPAAIEHKLVHLRRGGYCFEQNALLLHVLGALGYAVTPVSARVRFSRPREFTPPRTHLLLRVELEGVSWLVDVGVGGLSPTCALRLVADVVQETPHEPRRLLREGAWQGFELRAPDARLFHQAYVAGEWRDVCELTLEEMPPIDRELANWYTSAHPGSHFRDRLVVARATREGRVGLLNRELTLRSSDGSVVESRTLMTPDELHAALTGELGLVLPERPEIACAGIVWPSGTEATGG